VISNALRDISTAVGNSRKHRAHLEECTGDGSGESYFESCGFADVLYD
jgi:hypothetical protein